MDKKVIVNLIESYIKTDNIELIENCFLNYNDSKIVINELIKKGFINTFIQNGLSFNLIIKLPQLFNISFLNSLTKKPTTIYNEYISLSYHYYYQLSIKEITEIVNNMTNLKLIIPCLEVDKLLFISNNLEKSKVDYMLNHYFDENFYKLLCFNTLNKNYIKQKIINKLLIAEEEEYCKIVNYLYSFDNLFSSEVEVRKIVRHNIKLDLPIIEYYKKGNEKNLLLNSHYEYLINNHPKVIADEYFISVFLSMFKFKVKEKYKDMIKKFNISCKSFVLNKIEKQKYQLIQDDNLFIEIIEFFEININEINDNVVKEHYLKIFKNKKEKKC